MANMLKATVIVRLKEGVDDPEGKTIRHSLNLLGFDAVNEVKVAKVYEIVLDTSREEGEKMVEDMVRKLLVTSWKS
jgi:phosphoribosylformylglycinamidine synthase PurS subunit